MNIFVLDRDPVIAASYHCDKHVPKMIVESAQMLSTAHHVLDGVQVKKVSASGRNYKTWEILNEPFKKVIYKAVHINHPCTVWARTSTGNYLWLWDLAISLCHEFEKRFEKVHSSRQLIEEILMYFPVNIERAGLTPFARAMKSQPECLLIEDDVECYRNFYLTKRSRMPVEWKKLNNTPDWVTK